MGVGTKQPGGGGGSGGSDTFASDFVVQLNNGKTYGRFLNGQTVPAAGKKATEVLLDMAIEFLVPVFSSFSMAGQANPVEVGTVISGNRTFNWGTTNAPSVQTNSISIKDLTNNVVLAAGLANDGSEVLNVGSVAKTVPASHQWQINGTNTIGGAMTPATITETWLWRYFAGPAAFTPGNSAQVRALPQNNLFNGSPNTFNLSTGNSLIDFFFAVPVGHVITQVLDLDALNANITAQYILDGTLTVLDNGGNNVTYNLYHMHIAVPYSDFPTHRHQVTFN